VIRIDHEYRPQLTLDTSKVKRLALDAYQTPMIAELAPMIDGKPDFHKVKGNSPGGTRATVPNAADRFRNGK